MNRKAINYSLDAGKDDGSCRMPEQLRIKGVELKLTKSTNESGVEWDSQGLPDCYIVLGMSGASYETEVVNDIPIGVTVVYEFQQDIVIPLDTMGTHFFVDFYVRDKDDNGSTTMASPSLYLSTTPSYKNIIGNEVDFRKRVPLGNYSLNGMSVIALLEWE